MIDVVFRGSAYANIKFNMYFNDVYCFDLSLSIYNISENISDVLRIIE